MTSTDTLVIGAGAAGCFAALRFAEHGSVTLLEAGPDGGDPIPDYAYDAYRLPPEYFFMYRDAVTGQAIPQGRGLGGGTTINSAAALRGQPWDYDGWNVAGWSWNDCLPAFCAIEADEDFGAEEFHGSAGLIPISRLRPSPVDEAVFAWCRQQGYPEVKDHNAPGALGIGTWTANRRAGRRWGTWPAVLPAARQAGVEVRADAEVVSLCFEGKRCTGAVVATGGSTQTISAGRVILCAGAYGTPALLMRSGIGPEAVLNDLGVDPVSVLSGVGQNLQDHPWCLLDVLVPEAAMIEATAVSGALLRYELPADDPGAHLEAEIFQWQTSPYRANLPRESVTFTAALMVPQSRGSFVLGPAGPEIKLGLLSEEIDAERIAEVVKRTDEQIAALEADGVVAAPADAWWRTGEDPIALVHSHNSTYNHSCGTCRMGDPADLETVVAPDLSVLGTEGLAIADSSIFPRIPRANTNLAAMMVGYRAADLIA